MFYRFNRFTKFEESMKEFLLVWFLASRVLFIIVLLRVLLMETRVGLQITNSRITAESYYDIFIVRLGSLDSTRISHIFFPIVFVTFVSETCDIDEITAIVMIIIMLNYRGVSIPRVIITQQNVIMQICMLLITALCCGHRLFRNWFD